MNRLFSCLVACGLAACGAVDAPSPEEFPGEDAAKFAEYRVPVEEHPELEAYAVYPVSGITYLANGDEVTFGYGFPRRLAGVRQHIDLIARNTGDMRSFDIRVEISAEDEVVTGTGSCTRDGRKFECIEYLAGIKVDAELARERLLEDDESLEEIDQHLRVTQIFSVDPIGIVSFELKDEIEFARP